MQKKQKTTKQRKLAVTLTRKERQVMLPPAPTPANRERVAAKKLPNQDPDAQPAWTPEREVEYLSERLAAALVGLSSHRNEVLAHEALVVTLLASLEVAEKALTDEVPPTVRSNR